MSVPEGILSMGEIRLHEGELNVMELLWSNKLLAAKDIAKIIKEYIGWEKNTTYTVIKRLIDKGAIERQDPGFFCKALITKAQVRQTESSSLLDKLFDGSFAGFVSEFLKNNKLKASEFLELEKIINEYKP